MNEENTTEEKHYRIFYQNDDLMILLRVPDPEGEEE